MRSVPLAMTWELFSNGRWGMFGALLAAHAVPALILSALRFEGALDPNEESVVIIHNMTALMNAVMFGAAIISAQGKPSRLYTYPVSSATLVACQMFPAMAALFVESVVSTMVLNVVFQLDWPYWGPALFVACSLAALQAVAWLTEKSAWLLLGVTAVGAVLGLWFMSRYRPVLSRPPHEWRDVTPVELLTLLAFAVLSYAIAVVAVSRDRCGEALRTEALRAWFERQFDPAPAFGQPFRTPVAAQFWFEWRQKGAMPWLVGFLLLICLIGWVLFNRDPSFLYEGCLTTGYFLPIIGFVMGLVIGTSGPADGKFEMGQFLATRPITNSALSRIILKTTALNVAGGWIVWCLACLALRFILWTANALPATALPAEMRWWHVPFVLVGTWLTTSLLAVLILCGRQRFLAWIICGVFGLIILGIMFGKWGLSESQRLHFHQAMLVVNAVAFMGGTAWAFVRARHREMIRPQTVVLVAGFWALATTLVAIELLLHHERSFPHLMLLAGLAALTVAPLALTPLALAWNRHR